MMLCRWYMPKTFATILTSYVLIQGFIHSFRDPILNPQDCLPHMISIIITSLLKCFNVIQYDFSI